MMNAYAADGGRIHPCDPADPRALWYDLRRPEAEERACVAAALGIDLPTLDEMEEIETSSRLYLEEGVAVLTATVPERSDTDDPYLAPVAFVLGKDRLATVRHHDPHSFTVFPLRSQQAPVPCSTPLGVLVGLLDAITDRLADVLERAKREIDALSRGVFRRSESPQAKSDGFQETLEQIGRKGDLVSKIRECLSSLDRLIAFLGAVAAQRGADKDMRAAIKTLGRDVHSLVEYIEFLSQKITLLLDTTLGMINIEQNRIIKIFSVASVVFLPPTLIASLYGMNFAVMPELGWEFGYPLAVGAMVVAAILPYLYFKRRGWL